MWWQNVASLFHQLPYPQSKLRGTLGHCRGAVRGIFVKSGVLVLCDLLRKIIQAVKRERHAQNDT